MSIISLLFRKADTQSGVAVAYTPPDNPPATPTTVVITAGNPDLPAGGDYFNNALSVFQGTNSAGVALNRYNAFSYLEYVTDANTMDVSAITNFWSSYVGFGTNAQIGVWVNGIYQQQLQINPADNLVEKTFTVAITGTGDKTVRLVLGTQNSPNDNGTILGTSVTKVLFPSGSTTVRKVPVRQSKAIVFLTDSIGVGIGTSNPVADGYIPILRGLHQDIDMSAIGYGGKSLSKTFLNTDAAKVVTDQLSILFNGVMDQRVYIALGTNDYSGNSSGAQYQMSLGLDAIHAAYPNAKIYMQTPMPVNNETSVMTTLRQNLRNAAAGRSYCQVIEGPDLIPNAGAGYSPDGVHFYTNANAIIANNLNNSSLFATP